MQPLSTIVNYATSEHNMRTKCEMKSVIFMTPAESYLAGHRSLFHPLHPPQVAVKQNAIHYTNLASKIVIAKWDFHTNSVNCPPVRKPLLQIEYFRLNETVYSQLHSCFLLNGTLSLFIQDSCVILAVTDLLCDPKQVIKSSCISVYLSIKWDYLWCPPQKSFMRNI